MILLEEGVLPVLFSPNEDVSHNVDAVFESLDFGIMRLEIEAFNEVDVVAIRTRLTSDVPSCSTLP